VGSIPVASTKTAVSPLVVRLFFDSTACDGRENPRIIVGSRDERPKTAIYFFLFLIGARKLCPLGQIPASTKNTVKPYGCTVFFSSSATVARTHALSWGRVTSVRKRRFISSSFSSARGNFAL